jgi:hypothetical protein
MAVNLVVKEHTSDPTWEIVAVKKGNGVDIVARNDADDWALFTIKNDGSFYRQPHIGPESGFKLTTMGQLLESKSER